MLKTYFIMDNFIFHLHVVERFHIKLHFEVGQNIHPMINDGHSADIISKAWP